VYASVAFAVREIPWKSQIFDRVSFEEDVKNVLRGIARQNGVQIIFREGVEGEVSFEFNMLLNAAFNKVLIENDLEYDFDPKTNLITIFRRPQQREQAVVPLSFVSAGEVRAAAKRFNLGGEISVDSASQTAFIEGTREQVKTFEGLVKRLDAAAGARRTAAVTRKKVALAREKSAVRKRLIQKLLDRKIAVFKLRFANVAATKTKFHGKEIKIPGIEDTLKALLGDIGKVKEGLSEKQQKEIERTKPVLATSLSFSADARTNSIIVRGTQEDIDKVKRVIDELDRPVPMVEIDVMIIRAQRGISETLGVNWAYERAITGADHTRFIGLNTGVGSADPGAITQGIGSTTDVAATSGGTGTITTSAITGTSAVVDDIAAATQSIVAGLVLQNFGPAGALTWALQTQLEAFEQDNKTQTIASPTLVTLNNVAARIERRASQFFNVGQNNSATLQEVDVGLFLEITPVVIPREDASEVELIRLTIKARNTAISAGTFAASTAATSGQEIETEVIIPSGRTYMIGGLVDDTRIDNEKGVPFLMDLPVIGQLFRTDSSSDEFVETIFFITPRVIHSEDILPRDVAERRYIEGRRFGLAQTRADIQEGSRVLDNRAAYAQEDE
jgi:type II secretory pathway component GspD/PulD (secretin)